MPDLRIAFRFAACYLWLMCRGSLAFPASSSSTFLPRRKATGRTVRRRAIVDEHNLLGGIVTHQPRSRIGVKTPLFARGPRYSPEDDEDEYSEQYGTYDEFVGDDGYWQVNDRQRPRNRRRRGNLDDLGGFDETAGLDLPSGFGRRDGWRLPDSVSKALLAGVFVLGVGLGVTVDSQVNTNPRDLASRDAIDQAAPNPTLCAKLGASAMAFDQRVFVSFNPFNVYVSQADVKPACVLRDSNVVPVLKARGLINDDEVRACKNNMNTWAFVGSLEETPQLSCVYRSRDAQNEFLSNPKIGIGEDYLDDDRDALSTDKLIKNGLTEAQKELKRQAAASVAGI